MAGVFIFALLLFLAPGAYSKDSEILNVSDGKHSNGTIQLLAPDEVTLTQNLKVTVKIGGFITMFDSKTLFINVTTSDVNIVPEYDKHSILGDGKWVMKTLSIRFNLVSSNVPLLGHQVPVNVSVSLATNQSISVTVQLVDDRVEIGFLPRYQRLPCHPNESCNFSLNIKMSTAISTFNATLTLFNSEKQKVTNVTFPVLGESTDYRLQVTVPTAGEYTASLSVAPNVSKFIYWNRQNLTIAVEENLFKAELDRLTKKYENLTSKYDKLVSSYSSLNSRLENYIINLTKPVDEDLCETNKVDCGEFGKCHEGKCDCTYPNVYSGDLCEKHVGCKSDPCGSRGKCSIPDDVVDIYKCDCKNSTFVTGKNCTGCSAGQTGDECQFKMCNDELDCGSHGDCYYDDDTLESTSCYCKDGFEGQLCTEVKTTTSQPPPSTTPESLSPDPEPTQAAPNPTDDGNSNLLYGGLIVFIAVLVVCVAAYLTYHNKDKILELLGVKKESVVEMAMRTRTKKSKGYQKLPTSIHDTVTHED